jgi:hypothetical protein
MFGDIITFSSTTIGDGNNFNITTRLMLRKLVAARGD